MVVFMHISVTDEAMATKLEHNIGILKRYLAPYKTPCGFRGLE